MTSQSLAIVLGFEAYIHNQIQRPLADALWLFANASRRIAFNEGVRIKKPSSNA
ncbi:hypothetical protein MMD27_000323 [Acinetobacter baumannii]|nr:hypothetical protein [Acinetobacter baumannii]